MVLSYLFKVPNRAARVNENVRTSNAQSTVQTNQPGPANTSNVSINLESVRAAEYVFDVLIITIDRVCSFRPAAKPAKRMSLGMKILIVCVIGLAVGGIAAGVATYFALAGKTNV